MQKKTEQYNKKQLNAVQNLSAKNNTKTPQSNLAYKTRAKYECSEKLAEMIHQANLLPEGFNFSIEDFLEAGDKWMPMHIRLLEYVLSLPDEIRAFVFLSEERIEYEKEDSREFWINNDGYAQDRLIDLNADDQISDELFNQLINSDAEEIADCLVDLGYYGREYSYAKQRERESEKESEDSYGYSSFRDTNDKMETQKLWEVLVYVKALERLQSIRDFLLAIINLANNLDLKSFPHEKDSYQIRKNNKQFAASVMKEFTAKKLKEKVLATSINIKENGEIQFSISEWASALQSVDVTRIRLCEVCGKIFWAKRSDAFACSKKHAKTRQMRLLRKNWKASGNQYLKARKIKENKNKEK